MSQKPPPMDPEQLSKGDILLYRSPGQISRFLCWIGDSPYSHAAFFDGSSIIEAGPKGVYRRDTSYLPHYEYVDVYRFKRDGGTVYPPEAFGPVVARGDYYIDKKTKYGFQEAYLIAIIIAARRKVGIDYLLDSLGLSSFQKWVFGGALRIILDSYVPDDPSQVVCSELVYRCYAEAATEPAERFKPIVEEQPAIDRGPLDVDFYELLKELCKIPQFEASAPCRLIGSDPAAVAELDAAAEKEMRDDLNRRLEELQAAIEPTGVAAPDIPIPIPNPNPQTVIPLDLQTSPSLLAVGRIVVGG